MAAAVETLSMEEQAFGYASVVAETRFGSYWHWERAN